MENTASDEKKKILVILPICEGLEEEPEELFSHIQQNLKEIEASYLLMVYDVEIMFAGLSCKWSSQQKRTRAAASRFYSSVTKFNALDKASASFYFFRNAVSDREVLYYAAQAAKRREEHYDYAVLMDSSCQVDRRSWIYKSVKHKIEEEHAEFCREPGAEVMVWSYFKDLEIPGPMFTADEQFKGQSDVVFYTVSSSKLPDAKLARCADFVRLSPDETSYDDGWMAMKASNLMLKLAKFCPEKIFTGHEIAIWIDPSLAPKLNMLMVNDLVKRAKVQRSILLESSENVLHKSFKFKDMFKDFAVKLLWSKISRSMKLLDSSVVIRDLADCRLLSQRLLDVSTLETDCKDGFDLVLSKAVNDCRLENIAVCRAEDFKAAYFLR